MVTGLDGIEGLTRRLDGSGVEFDQRLRFALEMAESETGYGVIHDHKVFTAVLTTNPAFLRLLSLPNDLLPQMRRAYRGGETPNGKYTLQALERALVNIGKSKTITVRDFFRSLLDIGVEKGESFPTRPYFVDDLAYVLTGRFVTPLSAAGPLRSIIQSLWESADQAEDFQYLVGLEGDRIVFRVVSVLDDYVTSGDSGLLVPQRALLTHFKDQFGGFTSDEISELEDLLNSRNAREQDFQVFFERNPHFFRKWDYREVHSQVHLRRDDAGTLMPDFILTDREAQKAAIIELKLPGAKLIRRQDNRDRFAAAMQEARSQLLTYKRWFREASNRNSMKDRLGIDIYEPHLSVIIGRATEFECPLDRQILQADNPDIEVVTYDDMLRFADQRRILIGGDPGRPAS